MLKNLKRRGIFPLFLFFIVSCGTGIPPNEDDTLAPPQISYLSNGIGSDGNPYIEVFYYGYNVEKKFDGYNVYISNSTNLENQKLTPLKPDGTEPTIKLTPNDADSTKLRKFIINTLEDGKTPLSKGVYYTVMMRAHGIDGTLSKGSNEISIYIE